jgi:hypothetical protein
MEAKKQGDGAEDLSMEDILQSIRKIIADDGAEGGAAAPKESVAVAGSSASDILELTDMLEEDGTVTNVSSPANAEDVLSSIDAALAPEPEPEPTPEPTPVLVQPAPPPPVVAMPEPASVPSQKEMSDEELEGLLSKAASDSALSSLNKLKTSDAPPSLLHPPSPAFRSGTTVEDMVAEMLRPMMKEWLDANLPAIVERIVEREVIRLARR